MVLVSLLVWWVVRLVGVWLDVMKEVVGWVDGVGGYFNVGVGVDGSCMVWLVFV